MPEQTTKKPGKPVAIFLDVANAEITKKTDEGLARERRKWEAEARQEELKQMSEQAVALQAQLANAAFMLRLFLSANDRQAIPGDLEEEYWTEILPKYGARRACFWFWTQALQAIATRNPICKWLLVGTLFRATAWIWRKIGG